uniref:L1 transposable element RRM domain-containing protein n=1 Tax=Equus caballus TaxID=9796 RepID=A0A9L0S670_HORSE
MENIKKNESQLKRTIIEMKNSLEGCNSGVDATEEWMSDLDERVEGITQDEHKKRIAKNEDSPRNILDNIKYNKILIIGDPEGEERNKGAESLFEEMIDENFPSWRTETHIQIQEAQRTPNKMNPKKPTPRYSIIKISRIKNKERILKATGERQQVHTKETP